MAQMETFLGKCTIELSRIPLVGKKRMVLQLLDTSSGSIEVECEYIALVSEGGNVGSGSGGVGAGEGGKASGDR